MANQIWPASPRMHYVVLTVTSSGCLKLYLNPCELFFEFLRQNQYGVRQSWLKNNDVTFVLCTASDSHMMSPLATINLCVQTNLVKGTFSLICVIKHLSWCQSMGLISLRISISQMVSHFQVKIFHDVTRPERGCATFKTMTEQQHNISWSLYNAFLKQMTILTCNLATNTIEHVYVKELYIILSTLEKFECWNWTV